jgi:SAM-dependent methyltransferase
VSSTAEPFYREYVTDSEFAEGYNAYQRRYADTVRESDRVIIDLVRELVASRPSGSAPTRLLDLGCSTGNLLGHLRGEVSGLDLTGGDLMGSSLEQCRANPSLEGISFDEIDALAIGRPAAFDIVVVNAVFYMFSDADLEASLRSISDALAPGGALVVFDFFHPFDQDLAVLERSPTHRNGLMLHFRPFATVASTLAATGLAEPRFMPFEIPIDLPRPKRDDDISSYTVSTAEGGRLLYRGALSQPWCHLVAVKRAA